MDSPSSGSAANAMLAALADLLHEQRPCLMRRWRERVMAVDSARGLSAPALDDHLPALLDGLSEIVRAAARTPASPVELAGDASRHGIGRLRAGYDIEEVVAELSVLRACIHDLCEERGLTLAGRALRVLDDAIDQLIAEAVAGYARATAAAMQRQQQRHLAFVAHDLRTPLGAIALALAALDRALARHAGPDEVVPRMLASLHRNVARLTRLIDDVRDAENDGSAPAEQRVLALRPVVEELVQALEPKARADRVGFRVEVPGELRVLGDPDLLGRALQNLLANAVDASPEGGVVTVGAEAQGETVSCWVRDQGPGVPRAWLDRIFEEGVTSHGDAGHRGLGLAIARRFVHAQGGRIRVDSSDRGTRFTVVLPAAPSRD